MPRWYKGQKQAWFKERIALGFCRICGVRPPLEKKKSCEWCLRRHRWNDLKKTTGLTRHQYEIMYQRQDGHCAICRRKDTIKQRASIDRLLGVDHDHETGQIRGLLCYNCNLGIGHLKDSPDILREAIRYLETATLYAGLMVPKRLERPQLELPIEKSI